MVSVRLRNLLLRLLHGDIYTKQKLAQRGVIEEDSCEKCGQQETLMHLLTECWYPARVWRRLFDIYKKVDRRARDYELIMTDVLAINMIRPRLALHLEIIRLLQIKNRPNVLPRQIIRTALLNLIAGEKRQNDWHYLVRLRGLV